MRSIKDCHDKDCVYDIMYTAIRNYDNMLKRLSFRKQFSNFCITYYSIVLIVLSLTVKFFPCKVKVELSSYYNIVLSVVVLVYSLVITNANYSDRINAVKRSLNEIKIKKGELDDDNVAKKCQEYDLIISNTEYRSDIDFFRTLKQRCKKNNISWMFYKKDLKKLSDEKEAEKLNSYLSENSLVWLQLKIISQYMWNTIIFFIPIVLFISCLK